MELFHPTRVGLIDILAKRGNETYALGVYVGGVVGRENVKELLEKARLVNAKPTIVLYGDAGLDDEAKKLCKEGNVGVVKLRRS